MLRVIAGSRVGVATCYCCCLGIAVLWLNTGRQAGNKLVNIGLVRCAAPVLVGLSIEMCHVLHLLSFRRPQ